MRRRLDAELVRRGISRSREHAQALIAQGGVLVAGVVATKPATQVDETASIALKPGEVDRWVSRGAHKLLGALEKFDVPVQGRQCLDAGISTGGFTQVLLERGAAHVVGVDVGYGQVAWSVRTDPRVTVLERTNVRALTVNDLPYRPDLVVADLSFISLTLVLPALTTVAADGADLLLMVKPQFEVGRERVGSGGVVRDPDLRIEAVATVVAAARERGWGTAGVTASPLPGPQGNVEYFTWLRQDPGPVQSGPIPDMITAMIATAVQEGPA